MKLTRDVKPDLFPKGCVLAIGNFDGVHLGHREIIHESVALARALQVPAAVMSFEPHPREFFGRTSEPLRLFSCKQKAAAIAGLGIDQLILLRFNQALASTSADDFVERLLIKTLSVRHVVTGSNFAFGKGRGGDSEFLTQKARVHGFGFTAAAAVTDGEGRMASSSAIRELLKEADLNGARAMLGDDYAIAGHVIRGEARGRKLGFPTMNIALRKRFIPRKGVYAATVEVAGRMFDAVVNIGVKPTFGVHTPLLEAHAFGLAEEVYGRYAKVSLKHFIRDEKKFEGADALKEQITHDTHTAQTILAR